MSSLPRSLIPHAALSTEWISHVASNIDISNEEKNSAHFNYGSNTSLAPQHDNTLENQATSDPNQQMNLVDWDGPEDPANPLFWSNRKKWLNIGIISVISTVT